MKNVLVLTMCLCVLFACKKPSPVNQPPPDTSTPTLSYPLASFSSVNKFIPFGAPVSGGLSKGYGIQFTDTSLNFLAACQGIVESIGTATDGSPLITIKYKSNSIYSFQYSGFRTVLVNVNDSLAAGSELGRVGFGLMNFELIENGQQALCPQNFSSPGFMNSIALAISRNNALNPTDSVYAPCSVDSLPK